MTSNSSIQKEFSFNSTEYTLFLQIMEGSLCMKLTKPLDFNFWELCTNLEKERKLFPILIQLEFEDLIGCIISMIESKDFKLVNEDDIITIEFSFEISLGMRKKNEKFCFRLVNKKGDIGENLSSVVNHLKKIESSYQTFTDNLMIKMNDIKKDLEENNKRTMDLLVQECKGMIEELKTNNKIFLEKQIDLEFTEFRRFELLKHGEKIYPKFINVGNGNYSNDNRTVERSGSGWFGFRCEEIPISNSNSNKFNFSIRIDKTDANCNIMIGYCLNSQSNSSGYYNSQCIVALFLNNGHIYSPSGNVAATGLRASSGMIITSVLDLSLKLIYFLGNGYMLGIQRYFTTVNQDDYSKICPFVDLQTQSDKVSIIK